MKLIEFGVFLIVTFFVSSVFSNDCKTETTCGSCIQRNGTCGWCLSPDYKGDFRCETKERLTSSGCPEHKVLQSINSAHLQKNRKVSKKRLLQPQKVTLQLVPNTGYVLPVKAYLLAKNNDRRLGGEVILSVKAPKYLKVTMKSDCNNNHPAPVETSSCHGVHDGPTATFSFTILTETCFAKKKTIYVRANNMRKAQLVIVVKAKCECDCERKKTVKDNAQYCKGNGKLVCGQCNCNHGIYGRNCECIGGREKDEKDCIRPGDSKVCSGNGNCLCGNCLCLPDSFGNNRYSGRYCSCDRMSCPRFNGSVCGGIKHGECNCGQCICRENYQGQACENELRSENCVGSNGKVCSGNGICEQEQCHCKQPFYGKTCEEFDEEPILAKYCRKRGSNEVCSNRGTCVRGSCHCNQAGYLTDQAFSGRFCECDDYHCEQYNGELCGGLERGTCHCGKCTCRENFTGSDCSISMSDEKCRSPNGAICDGRGMCVNNMCQCQSGYSGSTCEHFEGLPWNLTRYCIESGKTDVCSNRGKCVQGSCRCEQSRHGNGTYYTGRYCECDDYACDLFNGEVCGGRERGICSCGKCRCQYGFFGPDCSLTKEHEQCLTSDGKICSDQGTCENNQCRCNDGYKGRTCDVMVQTDDEFAPYCIARNSTEICSNRGTCIRGRCQCYKTPHELNKKFTGRYCECDDYSCVRINGKLCGGEELGKCLCGKCLCRKHYTEPNCTDGTPVDKCTSSNGKICNGHGKCVNRKCKCDERYSGPTCEEYDKLFYTRTKICRHSPDAPVCSGRGTCTDGQCICHQRVPRTPQWYTGQYCECDDYNCDYYNGQLCGGPERGKCVCGICRCLAGYLGSDCSGSNSTEGCRAANGRLCNGQGLCENNKCRCEGVYAGPTCEQCPTCPGLCETLKPCVLCRVFGTGNYTFEKCIKCDPIVLVDRIEKMPTSPNARFCLFLDSFDNCRVQFTVERSLGGSLKVTALSIKECPSI